MKRTITLLLAVMMMGTLFSACGKTPRDTPYTFRVADDETGERQWNVHLDYGSVVSYEIRHTQDGQTDVVFTGKKKGSSDVTVYLARENERETDAVDAYVLTLKVDARKNVTQPEPPYGAYTVRMSGDVTGAEWHVECSDERIVRWKEDREYPKKSADEDGMQDFTQVYTFTGRRPGATRVRVYVTYPWAEDATPNTLKEFWLLVDDAYRVSLLEPTDFTSFRVSEQGTSAIHDVYEAERMADGVRLTHYEAQYSWSDETNGFAETRQNETVIDGGEELYMYLAGLVRACDVPDWDGFRKSDSRVLDGKMFEFKATLADGSTVSASGSNAYPKRFRTFWNSVSGAVSVYMADKETE